MTHTTKHTPTGEVMAHFNLSDEEWDGLPSFMQQKLTTVYCQHAAAPAMYEALQWAKQYLRMPDFHPDNSYNSEEWARDYNKLNDALAQAEGGGHE